MTPQQFCRATPVVVKPNPAMGKAVASPAKSYAIFKVELSAPVYVYRGDVVSLNVASIAAPLTCMQVFLSYPP